MAKCTIVVCDTAKVRFFKQITTIYPICVFSYKLFAILQKYDFSSKSQRNVALFCWSSCCLRYCKSTIFQANHNIAGNLDLPPIVVCDTAKVRFFKQITTWFTWPSQPVSLFAILQKYDFSSKSQLPATSDLSSNSCLRYCKSTIFQANHNRFRELA